MRPAEPAAKSIRNGFFAALGLLGLYVLTMTLLTRSWEATWEQFQALWWLMLPLAAGFGVQVGLYTKLIVRGARRGGVRFRGVPRQLLMEREPFMERGLARRSKTHTDLRRADHNADRNAAGSVTASGTSATVGMLACCAHHATDVLPLIGLSGLSLFLSTYQIPLLAGSLLINIFGIFLMLKHLQQLKNLTNRAAA